MTSKSSSFLKTLKSSFRLRIWPAALSLLLFFLYNVVGLFLFLSAKNQMDWGTYSELYILRQKEGEVLSVLGGNSGLTPILAGLLAIVFAVQEFSWLNSRREIDFYESQPVLRRDRFFSAVLGGFLIYLLTCLVTFLAGAAIAAGMGVMSGPLLSAVLYEELRSLILFTGVYLTAILAMMLCGSTLIAILATGVLLIYEPAMRSLLALLRRTFYTTFCDLLPDSDPLGKPLLSAAAYYLDGAYSYAQNAYLPITAADVGNAVRAGAAKDLKSLILSAVLLLLAYIAFRHRKNESAGSAVVFAPVRSVVKVLLSVFAGTAAGLVCYGILGENRNTETLLPSFLMIVFFALLMCCVMEIIYHFDLKALFRNPAGILVSAALSVFLFAFFCYDISGYDRYLPQQEDVEYACVYPTDNMQSYLRLDENGSPQPDFDWFSAHMKSADIAGVEALARIGIENSRTAVGESAFSYFVVAYHMKSGKQIIRRYRIPADADPAVLDALLGTDVYRSAAFPLEGYAFDGRGASAERGLTYTTGYDSRLVLVPAAGGTDAVSSGERTDSGAVRKFADAYRADLQHYNYSMAHGETPVGVISLQGYLAPEDSYQASLQNGTFSGTFIEYEAYYQRQIRSYLDIGQWSDYTLNYPVYPEFTETIAFLKDEGIYLPALPAAEDIASITVYRYPDESDSSAVTGGAMQETTVCTDPSEIRQILENCVSTMNLDPLYDMSLLDSSVNLEFRLKDSYPHESGGTADAYWSAVSSGYAFPVGRVPAFLNP